MTRCIPAGTNDDLKSRLDRYYDEAFTLSVCTHKMTRVYFALVFLSSSLLLASAERDLPGSGAGEVLSLEKAALPDKDATSEIKGTADNSNMDKVPAGAEHFRFAKAKSTNKAGVPKDYNSWGDKVTCSGCHLILDKTYMQAQKLHAKLSNAPPLSTDDLYQSMMDQCSEGISMFDKTCAELQKNSVAVTRGLLETSGDSAEMCDTLGLCWAGLLTSYKVFTD
jgi:hypothetical protein